VYWASIVVGTLTISAYVITRTVGLLVGPAAHQTERIGFGDLTTTAFEAVLVVGSLLLLFRYGVGPVGAATSEASIGTAAVGVTALTVLALFSVVGNSAGGNLAYNAGARYQVGQDHRGGRGREEGLQGNARRSSCSASHFGSRPTCSLRAGCRRFEPLYLEPRGGDLGVRPGPPFSRSTSSSVEELPQPQVELDRHCSGDQPVDPGEELVGEQHPEPGG